MRLSKPVCLLLIVVACAWSVGCTAATPVKAPPIAESPFPAVDAPRPYRMLPGDELEIRYYNNPELDTQQPVRPDGLVSLPYVGQVRAAGRTPEELEGLLVEDYRAELTQPDISVIVQEYAPQRVYVGGEVVSPAAIDIHGPLTTFQAIQEAGGFRDTARVRQVVVMRQAADGQWLGRAVDLRDVRSGANPSADIFLRPTDIVFVPRTNIASVNQFVRQYVRDASPINLSVGVFWNPVE
jgi:protein involved in polysaccharide export with SLBB domain